MQDLRSTPPLPPVSCLGRAQRDHRCSLLPLQPGEALWSTVSSIASQIGVPPPPAGVPNFADAARAAMLLSQLTALQPSAQAAAQPPLITPPPAYVAQRADGATQRQPRGPRPRPTAREHAGLNRNDVWIPYSTAILGSYSPYPQIRAPELCFEDNVPNSHAGNECPDRFLRIFGAPLPGWTSDGKKEAAAWTGDGAAMLQPTHEALTKYLKDHGVPAHRSWRPRSLQSGGAGPHERHRAGRRRWRFPGRWRPKPLTRLGSGLGGPPGGPVTRAAHRAGR